MRQRQRQPLRWFYCAGLRVDFICRSFSIRALAIRSALLNDHNGKSSQCDATHCHIFNWLIYNRLLSLLLATNPSSDCQTTYVHAFDLYYVYFNRFSIFFGSCFSRNPRQYAWPNQNLISFAYIGCALERIDRPRAVTRFVPFVCLPCLCHWNL